MAGLGGSAAVAVPAPLGRIGLFAGLLGNAAGHAFVFAVLPPLGRRLGFADIQTGLLLSFGALALIVAAPLWGLVAERWGRRPVLLVGLVAAAVAPALFGLVVQRAIDGAVATGAAFALLLSIRLGQSLLAGGLLPAAQAYVADVTSAARRAGGMGRMSAAFGLGSVVGAGVAWTVAGISLPLGFACIAGLIVLGAVGVCIGLAEPVLPARPADGGMGRLPMRGIWRFLLVTFLGVMTYALMQQVTGLRLQDQFGLAPQEAAGRAGAALTVAALAMVTAQGALIGALGWPPIRLLRVGGALGVGSTLALAWAQSDTQIVGAMAVFGLGLGLLLPANLAALSLAAGSLAQARAAGINAIGQGLGMVAGPVAGAALYQASPALPYLVAAGLLAGILAIAVFAPRAGARTA